MTDRRYDDEEAREIFARAAEAETAPGRTTLPASGRGLTLAELREIGEEVGLSPDAIQRAARTLDAALPARRESHMGLPVAVSRTVPLTRPVDDEEWHHLVANARRTFGARGKVEEQGRFREWWNGNLRVALEPSEDGDVLQMSTRKSSALSDIWGSLAVLTIAGVIMAVLAVGGELNEDWVTILGPVMIALGGLFLGGRALSLPKWARERQHQFEAIAHDLLHGSDAEATGPRPLPAAEDEDV